MRDGKPYTMVSVAPSPLCLHKESGCNGPSLSGAAGAATHACVLFEELPTPGGPQATRRFPGLVTAGNSISWASEVSSQLDF